MRVERLCEACTSRCSSTGRASKVTSSESEPAHGERWLRVESSQVTCTCRLEVAEKEQQAHRFAHGAIVDVHAHLFGDIMYQVEVVPVWAERRLRGGGRGGRERRGRCKTAEGQGEDRLHRAKQRGANRHRAERRSEWSLTARCSRAGTRHPPQTTPRG